MTRLAPANIESAAAVLTTVRRGLGFILEVLGLVEAAAE
jgi:hypothetical protein